MSTKGFKELSAQLSAMGSAVGGSALRSAANSAMNEAKKAARKAAPVGSPPYTDKKTGRQFDPYPIKTYKGRLRTPGFTSRNIATKAKLSRDRTKVNVMLGVKPEAFYAIQFLELGTSTIPKQPWLEPAFRQSLPAVEERLKVDLKKRIDKAARK